jgi:hypothetical protein
MDWHARLAQLIDHAARPERATPAETVAALRVAEVPAR